MTTTKLRTTVVGCILVACLVGCSHTTTTSTPTSTTTTTTAASSGIAAGGAAVVGCMAPPVTAETHQPAIAVLTGNTAGDLSPAVAVQRQAAITRITQAGFAVDARLLIDVIGGSVTGDLAVNTQLDTPGANQLFRQNAARCKTTGVTAALNQIQAHPAGGPVDVLGALARLDAHLTGLTDRQVDVVLLSNMVNATPVLRLDRAATLARNPTSLIDSIAADGLLPNCHGWDVYVIGAGNTPGPGLADTARARLHAFWDAFFARCGGRVVTYDSELTQFPVTPTHPTTPPAVADATNYTTTPPPPAVVGARLRTVTITLADTVLFDNASDTLSATAAGSLAKTIATMERARPVGPIWVKGYTDITPAAMPGGNRGLSVRRAAAVVTWLSGHGIPATNLVPAGMGPTDPVSSNATPAGRARNRRVEISFRAAVTS